MTAAPSHDYWGTVCARNINIIDIASVKYSDYHQTDKVVEDCDDETREVVLLQM